ncbi:putative FAD-depdendent monooxygenase [Neospora caninum Liverpool]|uniref:Putative FAD-depdendent monooxygenase n=1 Tax=Neospora caninum (strain Liverpool) TaxID=572307 RepID=F0VCT4_NEOCL|nr:putative FAD-depdendent monooxygenase [Neospora caninum Liverpool]CBZ51449.1 putative FAD-depdendent monooxygenase [Neospora caninum Liverpool]|eukprot:XP_003881482.1 putative FAD-depdendent monooxygenase [Neospora caninum Liverpool]
MRHSAMTGESRSLSRYSFSSSYLDQEDEHSFDFSSNASESSFQSSCAGRSQARAQDRSFFGRPEDESAAPAIPSRVDVVIVGAGPVGLTLAIDCQRKGLSYLCVDVRQDMVGDSRAILLHPRTLEIMQDLGVADALILRGIRLRGLRMFLNGALASETPLGPLVVPPQQQSGGVPFSSFPTALFCGNGSAGRDPFSPFPRVSSPSTSSSTPFPYAVVLDQSATEAILHDRLRQLGGHVHRPVAVWRLEHQDVEEPPCFPPVPLRRRRRKQRRSRCRSSSAVEREKDRNPVASHLEAASEREEGGGRLGPGGCAPADNRRGGDTGAGDKLAEKETKRATEGRGEDAPTGDAQRVEKDREGLQGSCDTEEKARLRESRQGESEAHPAGPHASPQPGRESEHVKTLRASDLPFLDSRVKTAERRRFTTTAEPQYWSGRAQNAVPVATGFLINEEHEDEEDIDGYPVVVHMAKLSDVFGTEDPAFISVRCRYVVGCDGAKSMIRKASSISFDGTSRASEFLLADLSLDWSNLSSGMDHQEVSSLADPSLVIPDPAWPEKEARIVALHRLLRNSPLDRLNLFLSDEGSLLLTPLLPPYYRLLPGESLVSGDDAYSLSSLARTPVRSNSEESEGGYATSTGQRDERSDRETDGDGRIGRRDREKDGGLGRATALLVHTEASGNLRWRIMALRESSSAILTASQGGRGEGTASQRDAGADLEEGEVNGRDLDRGPGSADRRKGANTSVSEDELVHFIEKMIPATVVRRIHWSCAYSVGSRVATRFKERRCFLAGDAAHSHPPFFSEGLNLGIQDAYNLGWKLGSVLKGGASTRLLESYHHERHQIAKEVMLRAGRTLDFIFGSGGKPSFLSRCVLKVMGPLLSRLPALADAVSRSFSVIDATYQYPTDVLGVAGTTSYASLVPGMQAPDCLVKVTEIYPERSPLPPPAPPTYLYELLGSSQHVLLLHILLLPAGSRVRNVFGCEMPGAPLAATSITTALPRDSLRFRGGSGNVWSASPTQSFSFFRRFSSASVGAPGLPLLPLLGLTDAGEGQEGERNFLSVLSSAGSKLYAPSSEDSAHEREPRNAHARSSGSSASSTHSAPSGEGDRHDKVSEASDAERPNGGDAGSGKAEQSDGGAYGPMFSGSLGSLSGFFYGRQSAGPKPRESSPTSSPRYSNPPLFSHESRARNDNDADATSTFLLRRHLLDLLPSGILSQLQGPHAPHPSLLLVDFVDEVATKFGLRLVPPGSAYADTRSGAFTLIRPDGHVAQGGLLATPSVATSPPAVGHQATGRL